MSELDCGITKVHNKVDVPQDYYVCVHLHRICWYPDVHSLVQSTIEVA